MHETDKYTLSSKLTPAAAPPPQKSEACRHTSDWGVKGARHSGHSGFWMPHSQMQRQQKTWPQGVLVGQSLPDRHRGQRLWGGTSAAAGVLTATSCCGSLEVAGGCSSSESSCEYAQAVLSYMCLRRCKNKGAPDGN